MAAMVSCTNEIVDNEKEVDNGQPVPVKLSAGVGGITTKAALTQSSTFEAQVFASATTGEYTTSVWTNPGNIEVAEGAVTFDPFQYYPANGSKIYMKGFTPRGTVTSGKIVYTISGAEDIMATEEIEGDKSSTEGKTLAFEHLLTQLQIQVKAKDQGAIDAWGTITSITVNAETSLELNLADKTLTAATPSVPGDLALYGFTSPQALTTTAAPAGNIMVLPSKTAYVLTITTSESSQPVNVTITPAETTASQSHVITLTFNSAEVSASATVGEWTSGSTGEGEVN